MKIKEITLENGLHAVFQEMPYVDSVTVYVAVGAGPRYEIEKTAGLAHFLEHMLFEGTKKLPTSKNVAEYIEKVGGKGMAWTDKEYVSYNIKVPKKHLDIGFRYLSDILFNSLLDEKAIEKEKGIVLEELKRTKDNPEADIWDLWFEWIWGKNQPLGRSTLGDETTIKNITREKLQEYIKKFYYPSNMAIAVVGNFSTEMAEKYILEYFGKDKRRNLTKPNNVFPEKRNLHTKILKVDTNQTQLMLGFVTGVSYSSKDRFAMRLISSILSCGVSARLFHKLVYQLGIAYSAWAYSWPFTDTGLFYISGGFSAQNTKKAIEVIIDELEKLKKEKIMEKELAEAKEKDKAQFSFSMETPDAIAALYSSQQITEGKVMTVEEIIKKIDKVTPEDIQRVAKKYFTIENLYTIVRGPIKNSAVESIESLCKSSLTPAPQIP